MNLELLRQDLGLYLSYFNGRWDGGEKKKWYRVKQFQDNFNIDALDIAEMLKVAINPSSISGPTSPRNMLIKFAEDFPNEVREEITNLFDNQKSVDERIKHYIETFRVLCERANSEKGHTYKSSGQSTNSASELLALRYPDLYCDYRLGLSKDVTERYELGVSIKKNNTDKVKRANEINRLVREALLVDINFTQPVRGAIDSDSNCYNDSNLIIAAADFIYYVSHHIVNNANTAAEDAAEAKEEAEAGVVLSENTYGKDTFLSEVFMEEQVYDNLVEILKHKMNIVLQGPPGVGKTFVARRLAWSILGSKDNDRIEFVQFHQNYSYDDFVIGYKPSEKSFILTEGIFYRFCDEASKHKENKYFFIIDEINRGNLSKIFGELLMGIEKEYRDKEPIKLPYDNRTIVVPDNLYIIGLMNTADRSLALIDYALRRRFAFVEMKPGFKTEGFISHISNASEEFIKVIELVEELNLEIDKDDSLGEGFEIGHSYFSGNTDTETARKVVYYEILPTLKEYWFDDKNKFDNWKARFDHIFR